RAARSSVFSVLRTDRAHGGDQAGRTHRVITRGAHTSPDGSRLWRGVFLELLEIAVFDLAHKIGPIQEIVLRLCGDLARDYKKLVVDHFGPRDGATRWYEMSAPLKNKAQIPENEKCEEERSDGGRHARAAEELAEALKEDAQTKNK